MNCFQVVYYKITLIVTTDFLTNFLADSMTD